MVVNNLASRSIVMSEITFSENYPPPFHKSKDDYVKWKKKLTLWQSITDVDKKKHGGLITLCLDDETQDSVIETVSGVDLSKVTGADSVINHLDSMFLKDLAVREIEIYEEFKSYTRPENLSIREFCNEFEKKVEKDPIKRNRVIY